MIKTQATINDASNEMGKGKYFRFFKYSKKRKLTSLYSVMIWRKRESRVEYCSLCDYLVIFHLVLLQPRLEWWPDISLIYGKAGELRNMFKDTVDKVTQGFSSHSCPKVSSGVSQSQNMYRISLSWWCWCWWFITRSHPTLLLTAHWRIVQFPENRIATVRCKKMIEMCCFQISSGPKLCAGSFCALTSPLLNCYLMSGIHVSLSES